MQILVAAPDKESLQNTAQLLSAMSYEPLIARDGMEAWEIIGDQEINMVICEWRLPRVSGRELCKKIRALNREAYTYIIVLVDRDESGNLREIFECGADDCMIKPPNPHILKARIHSGQRITQFGHDSKKFQDTLRTSRNKLRIVFDALPEEIVAADLQGKIVSLNRAYVENRDGGFTDLWQQQIRADELYFMEKLDQLLFKTSLESVMEKGRPVVINGLATEQNGEPRRKQIQFLPVIDDRNKVIQVAIVVRDTTDEDNDVDRDM